MAGSVRPHEDALRQVFDDYEAFIATALGARDVALKTYLRLDDDAVEAVGTAIDEHRSAFRTGPLRRRYGAGAALFHAMAFPIMTHEPVRVHPFDEGRKDFGQRLANALYAIAMAFSYLNIDLDHGDEVVLRMAAYLTAGGASDDLEANLVVLRGFLDAYVRRTLVIVGPLVLRDRFAIV